ncbi:hypothetical protein [Glycomyces xiaoerkulensis]|uniref:hypothetical protein n=1 Tax=Glycomyces xiaoerkulensis TaxID=2038139 RepID=UPI000C264620|nr:hypothetical protein [Glycomyces xiaoerkulensis]
MGTVDMNRRRFRRLAAVAVPASLMGLFTALFVMEPDGPWDLAVIGASSGVFGWSLEPLMMGHYFRYRPSGRWIEARGSWGIERRYPRPGFERLEYSVAHAEIHETRADGKRRRLWIRPATANPDHWRRFVENFYPAARTPIVIRPPSELD